MGQSGVDRAKVSLELRLNLGFGTQTKCPSPEYWCPFKRGNRYKDYINISSRPNFVALNGGVLCVEVFQRRGSTVIKKFNVQIQSHRNKVKHVLLFLCSVVTDLPTTTKAPPPPFLSKMGKRETGWRGGGGGGLIYFVTGSSLLIMTLQLYKRLWPLSKGL